MGMNDIDRFTFDSLIRNHDRYMRWHKEDTADNEAGYGPGDEHALKWREKAAEALKLASKVLEENMRKIVC